MNGTLLGKKFIRGLYWPDYDGEKIYDHLLKRIGDIDLAVRLCRSPVVCVQAGGHVGMWARRLAKTFEEVWTFEPVPELYECLQFNTSHLQGVFPHKQALGEINGQAEFTILKSGRSNILGASKIADTPRTEEVKVVTIDSLNLVRCDALFLDVERYELQVLAGARETLARFNPVVTLEVLPGQEGEYHSHMHKLGYRLRGKAHNDHIFARQKE